MGNRSWYAAWTELFCGILELSICRIWDRADGTQRHSSVAPRRSATATLEDSFINRDQDYQRRLVGHPTRSVSTPCGGTRLSPEAVQRREEMRGFFAPLRMTSIWGNTVKISDSKIKPPCRCACKGA